MKMTLIRSVPELNDVKICPYLLKAITKILASFSAKGIGWKWHKNLLINEDLIAKALTKATSGRSSMSKSVVEAVKNRYYLSLHKYIGYWHLVYRSLRHSSLERKYLAGTKVYSSGHKTSSSGHEQ